MTDGPETRYTRSADGTNLAYQVSGEGPVQLVFLPVAPQSISSRTNPASYGSEGGWATSAVLSGLIAEVGAHRRGTPGTQ